MIRNIPNGCGRYDRSYLLCGWFALRLILYYRCFSLLYCDLRYVYWVPCCQQGIREGSLFAQWAFYVGQHYLEQLSSLCVSLARYRLPCDTFCIISGFFVTPIPHYGLLIAGIRSRN